MWICPRQLRLLQARRKRSASSRLHCSLEPRKLFLFIAAAALFVLVGVAAVGLYTDTLSLPFGASPSPPAVVQRPVPWGQAPKRVAAVSPSRVTQPPNQLPATPVPEKAPTKAPAAMPEAAIPVQQVPAIPSVPPPTKDTAPPNPEESPSVEKARETPPARAAEPSSQEQKDEPPIPDVQKTPPLEFTKEPAREKAEEPSPVNVVQKNPPEQAAEPSSEVTKDEPPIPEVEKRPAVKVSGTASPERSPQLSTVSPTADPDRHAMVDAPEASVPGHSQPPDAAEPDKERPGKTQMPEPTGANTPQPPTYRQAALQPAVQPGVEEPTPRKQQDMGPLLIEAIRNGDRDMVNVLMDGGADANSSDSEGATALMFAARTRCLSCVAALLKRGANVRLKDRHGDTALDIARRAGRTGAAELILAHDPEKGPAALLIASREGLPDLVQCLVENGVDVNATDQDGNTALMAASDKGNLDIVSMLLRKGADVRARNKQGQTALTVVFRPHSATGRVPTRIRRELVRMLEQHTSP